MFTRAPRQCLAAHLLRKASGHHYGVLVYGDLWRFALPLVAGYASAFGMYKYNLLRDRWLGKMLTALGKCLACRGVSSLVARIKELALQCRRVALGIEGARRMVPPVDDLRVDRGRHSLMQLSRFARALPAPGEDVGVEALREHRNVLCSTQVVKPEVLADLQEFSKEFSNKYKGESTFKFGNPSSSACLERSGEEGGTAACVSDLVNEFRGRIVTAGDMVILDACFPDGLFGEFPFFHNHEAMSGRATARLDEVAFLYDKRTEMSLEGWELCRERLFSVAASWLSVNWDGLPECRRVILLERGWKTRVVTPEEGAFGYLCSVTNSLLMGLLRNHPHIKGSITGNPADGICWVGSRRSVVRSLDLKSASDYLTLEVCRAVINGICDGCRAPDFVRQLMERAVGAHKVVEPDGTTWVTSRAALMGNPVTWPILNIVLAFCHMRVEKRFRRTFLYAVNGDDYLGCHSLASNRVLTSEVEGVGLRLSAAKDFLSLRGLGVFAEELVAVGRRRVYPTVSVRPLVGLQKDVKTPMWVAGPSIHLAVNRCYESWHRPLANLLSLTYSTSYSLLRRNGIDPTAPRWCGGGGFPGSVTPNTLRIARGILSQDVETQIEWISSLSSAWTRSVGTLASAHADDLAKPLAAEFRRVSTLEEGGQTIGDFQASLLGKVAFAYTIVDPKGTDRLYSITKVKRRVGETMRKIKAKIFWVPSETLRTTRGRLDELASATEPVFIFPTVSFLCDLSFRNTPFGCF